MYTFVFEVWIQNWEWLTAQNDGKNWPVSFISFHLLFYFHAVAHSSVPQKKGTKQWVGNEAGEERELVRGGSGDADRCRLGRWGEDKGRVVSKWAASPSPTSISRHSPSALPCTLYPRSYTPSLRSPWEQESSLSALEFLPLAAEPTC